MSKKDFQIPVIEKEKFTFVKEGVKISDQKFEDKPIGYFKDAWLRFRKNKASIFAAIIILFIVLFAIFAPLFNTRYDSNFLDPYYAKMGPRNLTLSKIGIAQGTRERNFNVRGFILAQAIGVGSMGYDGETVSFDKIDATMNPIKEITAESENAFTGEPTYTAKIDTYLEVGFMYTQIEQHEFAEIRKYEEETGVRVLFPLIAENEFYHDTQNANYWYKADAKLNPLDENGRRIDYSDDMQLVDNYMRDENGNLVYNVYTGGGDFDTAQYKVRVLYYNFYQYENGFEPEYLFGTDSQGYDLALRMAVGLRLSLLLSVCVFLINFVLGAMYGAVEGYYGGTVDLIMERVSDILAGVPFIVVATLFQMHLAQKLGVIPSLIFAFVVTGWIGTASRVRTQFYRFKSAEYVMAARTLGAKDRRIIWKHIFPNALGTIITSSVLSIPGVIFSESMLSFLGIVNLGGSDMTSLGTLLSDASSIWTIYPHLMIFPAIVISLLMICFNLFGNGLRDAFNPSLRGTEE